jgi:hypothetical protein
MHSKLGNEDTLEPQECNELVSIFVASVKTAEENK